MNQQATPNRPVINISGLRKLFPVARRTIFDREDRFVHAVDGVTLEVAPAEVLAVVGESGCGKSTLALTLLGLEKPTAGSVEIAGKELQKLDRAGLKAARRDIQMIFQDPYESLNPMMTIGRIVSEPLLVHRIGKNQADRLERAAAALEDAGLKPAETFLNRLPHELSGGQRQRVVIAAALALKPQVLIADEPVSMLDVSIRAEIINLLLALREEKGISILFITHDLSTVAYIADRIAVMYLGRIVEIGPSNQILNDPQHPYTRALLSVVPVPNPRLRKKRLILQGETPNPIDLPNGCRFHPRCPIAVDRCQTVDPQLKKVVDQHEAACILVGE